MYSILGGCYALLSGAGAYYNLRQIERYGGTERQLRLEITTMYDLLFSFMNQFCMISQMRPRIRRTKNRFYNHFLAVQDRLYLHLEPAPSAIDASAVASFINVRAEILVAALNSIKREV